MKMNELKNRTIEDLRALSVELRDTLRSFRFGGAGSRKRDVKQGRTLRHDIARIETELSERAIANGAK